MDRCDFSDDTDTDQSSEGDDDDSVEKEEDDTDDIEEGEEETDGTEEDDEEEKEPFKKRKKWTFIMLWLENKII